MTTFKEVVSSNIKLIGYEEILDEDMAATPGGMIHVVFNNNAHWTYGPFLRTEFDSFHRSESKGRYFQNLKNQVKVLKLEANHLPDYEPQPAPGTPPLAVGGLIRCPVCRATANTVEGVKHRVGCSGWALK